MKRFFETNAAKWKSPYGKLHVYIVVPEVVRRYVAEYHDVIRERPALMSVQRPEWMHVTVQLIEAHVADLAPQNLTALKEALHGSLADLAPFDLTMRPPVMGVHGVTLRTAYQVPEFTELVNRTRSAVDLVLGADALHPNGARQRPHASLGYGLTDGDSDPILGAVNALNADRDPVTFTVDQVALLAVDQDPEEGIYTWKVLDTIDLTAPAP
ncbi:2'-5' RNA ligase family protein [Kribbella sp. NBC_01245]|uniref:2'-5' RNA ligase family protein n=1 Tax=Kribbella sp. NBC_01245 TaxID=2903578 RepID=UPI002E2A30D0|nr:2'-5' RNA ligase family protein [Kribbella sp. NBC_01245]